MKPFRVASDYNHVRVEIRRPLRDVMSFTGHSIDDVVNSAIAKAQVLGYYKLKCWIRRQCEVVDLERQWSGQDVRPRRG